MLSHFRRRRHHRRHPHHHRQIEKYPNTPPAAFLRDYKRQKMGLKQEKQATQVVEQESRE